MFDVLKMKILLTTVFTLLTVVSSLANKDVKETGTEHGPAVIQCPYPEGYEDHPKYFCRGIFKECTTNLIRSDGKNQWTYNGRFSLFDNTEKKMFVVTIEDLSRDDEGPYGCGIEKFGQDLFTVVQLTVIEAPKPPNTHRPTSSTAKISTTAPPTDLSTTFTTDSSRPPEAQTNRTGSETEDTGSSTLPPHSDIFISVGGTCCGVLLMLAIISGLFCTLRWKPRKNEADQINSQVDNEDVRLYEEIHPSTNPTQENTSISTNQSSTLHTDQCSNPRPACTTIYSSISNPGPELHPEYTLATNPTPPTDNASQSEHSSNQPNHSQIYFFNRKALNLLVELNDRTHSSVQNVVPDENSTYSMITAPNISADRGSDYSTVGFPHN